MVLMVIFIEERATTEQVGHLCFGFKLCLQVLNSLTKILVTGTYEVDT